MAKSDARKLANPAGKKPVNAAGPTNFICSILLARASTDLGNPPSSLVSVILTDNAGSFADVDFIAVSEAKREILAVALAAISNKATVTALVDVPTLMGAPPNCYSLSIIAG